MFAHAKRPQHAPPASGEAGNGRAKRPKIAPPPTRPLYNPFARRPLEEPSGPVQRKEACACAGMSSECPTCQKKDAPTLERPPSATQMRRGSPSEDPAERQADEIGKKIADDLSGTESVGHGPLPKSVQQVAEAHLGVSVEGTYLDAGGSGQKKAKEESALAVTEGRHVAFGEGRLDAASREGRELLGHELVHVGQQKAAATLTAQAQTGVKPRKWDGGKVPAGMLSAGAWKPEIKGEVTVLPIGDDLIIIKGPEVRMPAETTVKLEPGWDIENDCRIEVGYLQTLKSSLRIARYVAPAESREDWPIEFELNQSPSPLPARDAYIDEKNGPVAAPWYWPPKRLCRDSDGAFVAELTKQILKGGDNLFDQPKFGAHPTIGRARLKEFRGADTFITAIGAKEFGAPSSGMTELARFEWEAPWNVNLALSRDLIAEDLFEPFRATTGDPLILEDPIARQLGNHWLAFRDLREALAVDHHSLTYNLEDAELARDRSALMWTTMALKQKDPPFWVNVECIAADPLPSEDLLQLELVGTSIRVEEDVNVPGEFLFREFRLSDTDNGNGELRDIGLVLRLAVGEERLSRRWHMFHKLQYNEIVALGNRRYRITAGRGY